MGWQSLTYRRVLASFLALILLSIETVDACSCRPEHPQTHFCQSHFVAVVRVWKPVFVNKYEIAYKVRINKIFKNTSESGITLGHAKLYTASDGGLCGVELNSGEVYLVSGSIISGKPSISLCSLVTRWSKVTSRQRKGLRDLYKRNCQCKILFTDWLEKGTVLDRAGNNSCLWERVPGPQDCQERYGICMQDSSGCSWYPSVPYKNCIKEYRGMRHWEHQRPREP